MNDIQIISDELPDFTDHQHCVPIYQKRWREKQEEFSKPFVLQPYDEILTMANLYRAYEKTRKNKSGKADVEEFELNLITNLNLLYEKLLNRQWDEIFQYHRFFIQTPKVRKIDALDFPGRIALHLICDNGLDQWFDRRLIKECAACRKGMGTDYARMMMADHLHHYFLKHGNSGYVLCLDVRHFFDSINHAVLKGQISRIECESMLELLCFLIDHSPEETGLPIGNQSSQWLALYTLDPIDRIIKEKYRCPYYVRYMDDLRILSPSKELLLLIWDELVANMNELHLEFNAKTQIIKIKDGFNFIGWHYRVTSAGKVLVTHASDKKALTKANIKTMLYDYGMDRFDEDKLLERVQSIQAHLAHGNTYQERIRYSI